ncbi:class I SAM-dependent methyltransferase [Paenibacillus solisilvae]|uniref:Class I SAM-dependent methyltransferase n=1 Tax=Paenibacillus solisilvae TaxID=2486751 RepID=A0ABW0VTW8_9BACL
MQTKEQCFDSMLTLTADLFFSIENDLFKPYYESGPNEVKSVLDVGCGNGTYLSRLSDQFPMWRCTGIEMDDRIFRYAQLKAADHLTFIHTPYENYQSAEPFDCVIIRLAAAHLQDRTHFMHWLRHQLHPHSIVILIDVEESLQLSLKQSENLPLFSELYQTMRKPLRASRLLSLKDSLLLESEFAGFNPLKAVSYSINADSTKTRKQMYDYMQAVTGAYYGSPLPPKRQAELNEWYNNEAASFEVGLFGLVLGLKA